MTAGFKKILLRIIRFDFTYENTIYKIIMPHNVYDTHEHNKYI
jgi:hypothetical protein